MRRQTESIQVHAPGRAHKLDPDQLPARFTCPDSAAEYGERAITLEQDRVLLARRLGPMAMNISLSVASYRGVALRILPGMSEAEDRVVVVLTHRDRAFDVPLFEAHDDGDVIAEWRLWATKLGLPLLIEGVDGHLVAAETRLGELTVERPRPRRRHSLLAGRRPRFPDAPPRRHDAVGATRPSRRARDHLARMNITGRRSPHRRRDPRTAEAPPGCST